MVTRRRLGWTVALLGLGAAAGCGPAKQIGPLPAPCAAVMQWLDTTHAPPGADGSVDLPMNLAHAAVDEKVWIGAGPGGRCVLTKTKLGAKDNFEGRLCCVGDLPVVTTTPAGARITSAADGGVLEELYVRALHPPSWAEVYFDLN